MKIGIISDIHANLCALRAVLNALDAVGVVKIICGGDIVGYGPSPLECLEIIEQRRIPAVRGNHDDMMLATDRDDRVRQEVLDAIDWTRSVLPRDARERLGMLPMAHHYAGIEVIHASHLLNPKWNYVVDPKTATTNFLFQRTAISFNGHTHLPLIALHRRGDKPKLLMFRDMELPKNHKFLINVGSVGQPRDRNPQAACAVFETRDRTIQLLRVPYDITETQRLMRQADLPPRLAARLSEGR